MNKAQMFFLSTQKKQTKKQQKVKNDNDNDKNV